LTPAPWLSKIRRRAEENERDDELIRHQLLSVNESARRKRQFLMIVRIEAIYESRMLKLREALPLPEHTTVTAQVKLPLGTREEEDAWQLDPMSQWESSSMREFFRAIRKVAMENIPVLILAEAGTEKELAALAIHKRSTQRNNSFVAIKCGGIPESSLTDELFGFETRPDVAVHSQLQGRILNAAGGTLFLDEIDALPRSLQMRVLRTVRDHVLEQPGGAEQTQIDIRLIATTSVDLAQAVREGKFLEELYHQLTVVTIALPPLRERKVDIVVLALDCLRKHALENCRHSLRFSRDAFSAIENYDWPGNVLELENRVNRAVIMAEGKLLTAEDLELESHSAGAGSLNLKVARESAERDVIQRALRKHSSKIAPAAAEMGISRPTLYELMEKYGINKDRG
jgi:two-component system NtrC family response regulator